MTLNFFNAFQLHINHDQKCPHGFDRRLNIPYCIDIMLVNYLIYIIYTASFVVILCLVGKKKEKRINLNHHQYKSWHYHFNKFSYFFESVRCNFSL